MVSYVAAMAMFSVVDALVAASGAGSINLIVFIFILLAAMPR
jgi:hypothetical protein